MRERDQLEDPSVDGKIILYVKYNIKYTIYYVLYTILYIIHFISNIY